MFFWNSLAFSMIQQMLAIWSLVPMPFLKPDWTSWSSQFTCCCDPMNCSTPGFPVLHHLPEFAQTHIMSQWCHTTFLSLSPPSLPAFSLSQQQAGSFAMSLFFPSGSQSIWASASVLSMNIQGWFSSGLTGLISLLSKEFSRVFSSTTVQKHQLFSAQSSLYQLSHLYVTTGKTVALPIWTFVGKVMSLLFNTLSRLVLAFLQRSKISWL